MPYCNEFGSIFLDLTASYPKHKPHFNKTEQVGQ